MPTGYSGVGILSLKAWLQSQGHPVRFLNLGNEAVPISQRVDLLIAELNEHPDVVAIGLNWVHKSLGAIQTARLVRHYAPSALVVIGGQHATLFAEELAATRGRFVDVVITGDAETALLDVLLSGEGPSRGPALVVPGHPYSDVDLLPLYDYEDVLPFEEHPVSALSTMRGRCTEGCLYCLESVGNGLPSNRPRLHSTDWLVEQTSRLLRPGRRRITIQDPFFLFGDAPLSALVQGLRGRDNGPIDEFNLFTEPGRYTEAGYRALGDLGAGLVTMDLGVESGAERVLGLSGRPYGQDTIMKDIESMVSSGIVPYTWWMVGMPGETEDDVYRTRDFMTQTMRAGAVPRWITPMLLFPGAAAYVQAERFGIRPKMHTFEDMLVFSTQAFSLDGVYPRLLTHDQDGLPAPRVLELTQMLKRNVIEHWPLVGERHAASPRTARHVPFLSQMFGSGAKEFGFSSFF